MKSFILIIIILFSISSFSNSQVRKLTLEQSIVLGLENSKELKISESKLKSSIAKIQEVKSQTLPQLKLNAGYTRLSNVKPYIIIVPFSATPLQISEILINNYSLKLSMQQPLFTGFRLSSLKNSAELFSKSSELDFDNEKNNVSYNIQITFWNYYKSDLIKKITDENVMQTEMHIIDTKNFLANGLATNSDLLKFEVQNSTTKLQQLEAGNNIEVSRISFNKILGLPIESSTGLNLNEKEVESELKQFNLNSLIDEAFNNRIELKSTDYKIKSAEENVKAVKSNYYPSLFLFGNYYLANPNQRIQPPENKFFSTWDAGVTLSWDFFNWGNTSAQVTQAQQILSQSQTNLEQLKDAIILEVNHNYLNLNYLNQKIEVTKKTIEQAQENYRVMKEKYEVQLATSTDLIDAETSLFQSKINYTTALVDYHIALITLYKSIGRKLY